MIKVKLILEVVPTCVGLLSGSGFSPAFQLSAAGSDNEIGAILGAQLDAEKAAGRGVRLVRSRIFAKAAKLLFRELVKTIYLE